MNVPNALLMPWTNDIGREFGRSSPSGEGHVFLKIYGRTTYPTVFLKNEFNIQVLSARVCTNGHRHLERHEEIFDPSELELQVVMSLVTWVLRTELQSSARAASGLNYGTTSLAFLLCFSQRKVWTKMNSSMV